MDAEAFSLLLSMFGNSVNYLGLIFCPRVERIHCKTYFSYFNAYCFLYQLLLSELFLLSKAQSHFFSLVTFRFYCLFLRFCIFITVCLRIGLFLKFLLVFKVIFQSEDLCLFSVLEKHKPLAF